MQSLYLVRHGETEWALSGRHTGRTDIPLTAKGEQDAVRLGARLKGLPFAHVFTSPLQRARRTAELAGFADSLELEPDLMEWDYGEFEGLRSVEILRIQPTWQLYRAGCCGGETVEAATARIDRLLNGLRDLKGPILLFAHGHILRVVAARFLGIETPLAKFFQLGTASVSILGYEHPPLDPAIQLWNDRGHLQI